jgi:hypothetical protein
MITICKSSSYGEPSVFHQRESEHKMWNATVKTADPMGSHLYIRTNYVRHCHNALL